MTNKTILAVDDDPNIVKLVQITLELNGFNVITAYNGKSGLEKTIEQMPDLILLDIDMPEMNGLQVLEEIKNNPSTAAIPVIMLTARTMGDDFEKAMERKADWYIAKPFKKDHLLEKINYLINNTKN